jgi:hypothetical protein
VAKAVGRGVEKRTAHAPIAGVVAGIIVERMVDDMASQVVNNTMNEVAAGVDCSDLHFVGAVLVHSALLTRQKHARVHQRAKLLCAPNDARFLRRAACRRSCVKPQCFCHSQSLPKIFTSQLFSASSQISQVGKPGLVLVDNDSVLRGSLKLFYRIFQQSCIVRRCLQ